MLTGDAADDVAFWAYAFAVVFVRARAIVLEREQRRRLGACSWPRAEEHAS